MTLQLLSMHTTTLIITVPRPLCLFVFNLYFCSGGVPVLSNVITFGNPSHSLSCLRLLAAVCQCAAVACDDMRRASLMPALVNLMRLREAGGHDENCLTMTCLMLTLHADSRVSVSAVQLLKAMIISSKANAQGPRFHINTKLQFYNCAGRYVARQQGCVVAAAELISRAALGSSSRDDSAAVAAAELLLALCSGPFPEAAQVFETRKRLQGLG